MNEDWRVPPEDEDPLLQSSRREFKVAIIFWSVFAAWTLGLGKLLAYQKHLDGQISTILGLPAWVFWVVILPWFVATLFTVWFALKFMKDHDLLTDSKLLNSEDDTQKGSTDPEGNE